MDLTKFRKRKDKELWLLEREDVRLPAYVMELLTEDEQEHVWVVWPAMMLLQGPYSRFYDLLSVTAKWRSGQYMIYEDRETIEKIMQKPYGVTPEFYYRWKGAGDDKQEDEFEPDKEEPTMPGEIDERFLKEVLARTQICSLGSLKIIWAAMVQTALQYLITKRRPITLGFCTIFAVPYRANWKSVLMRAFPRCYMAVQRSTPENLESDLEYYGIMDAFRGKELLAIKTGGEDDHWCDWKLECVPNKMWDKAVSKIEHLRINAGKATYASFIAKTIAHQRHLISAAFRRFILGAATPTARFSTLAPEGYQALLPTTLRGGPTAKALAHSSGDICCPTTLEKSQPRLVSIIEREVNEVSKLPSVRRQFVELRLPWNDQPKPDNEAK